MTVYLPDRMLGRACMHTDTSLMFVAMLAPTPCASLSPVLRRMLSAAMHSARLALADRVSLPSAEPST